jgi:hypothetical protein
VGTTIDASPVQCSNVVLLLLGPGRPASTIHCSRLIWTRHGRAALVAVCRRLPAACHGCHDGCPSLPSAHHPPSRGTFHTMPMKLSHTHPSLPCSKKNKNQSRIPALVGVSLPLPVPDALARRPQHNKHGAANLGPNERPPALPLTMGKPSAERRSETGDWRSKLPCCCRMHGGLLIERSTLS